MQALIELARQDGAQAVWKRLTAAQRLDFDIWLLDSERLQAHLPGCAWVRFKACVEEINDSNF